MSWRRRFFAGTDQREVVEAIVSETKVRGLRGSHLVALRRMPSSVERPRQRPRWTRQQTLETLLSLGLIEMDKRGWGLYRRTASGDAVVAAWQQECERNYVPARFRAASDAALAAKFEELTGVRVRLRKTRYGNLRVLFSDETRERTYLSALDRMERAIARVMIRAGRLREGKGA